MRRIPRGEGRERRPLAYTATRIDKERAEGSRVYVTDRDGGCVAVCRRRVESLWRNRIFRPGYRRGFQFVMGAIYAFLY